MILDGIEWKKEYMWLIRINLSRIYIYSRYQHFGSKALLLSCYKDRCKDEIVSIFYCGDNFSHESNLQRNLGIYAVIYLSKREFRSICSRIHLIRSPST